MGGFDESLQGAVADIDFCVKLRGELFDVSTPFTKLCWHEAVRDEIDANSEGIICDALDGGLCEVIRITIQIFLAKGAISR